MRFDSDASTSTEWKNWGTAHFSLSMVELSIVDEKATLACHIYKGDDIHEKLLTLQKMLESVRVEEILIPDSPLIRLERHDLPEYHQWCKLVKKGGKFNVKVSKNDERDAQKAMKMHYVDLNFFSHTLCQGFWAIR